jgi:hypothetical protein
MHGLHVTSGVFESFLHAMHALLEPLCAATAQHDAGNEWAPCSTAKLLVVVLFHLALFAGLHFLRSRAPPVPRKSVVQMANEVFMSSDAPASGSSTSVRSAESLPGLVQRR